MLRRILFLTAGASAIAACAPDVDHSEPQTFVTAVFDPTTAQIPLPNDLAFLNPLNTNCPTPSNTSTPPACAQAELLASFNGKFPSDQAVAITVSFAQTAFDGSGGTSNTAPDLDLTTFTSNKVYVVGTIDGVTGEIPIEMPTTADYVKGTTSGRLTIHHEGNEPWAGGSYSLVIRGGDDGIKTKDGQNVYASQVFTLIEQGKDMTDPANIGLLKAQLGSTAAAQAQGAALNQVIALYKQTAFPAADRKFPHQQLAIAATFSIQDTITNVEIDPARGKAPLPIDLLRDATTGKLTPTAACAFLSTPLAADGTCPNAAAAGFLALDGFSTTGAILAPTSQLVEAKTVTATSLRLYDLSVPAAPVAVAASSLILEPCEFTSGCSAANPLSPVIAIQPAGATAGDPSSVFRTKPLKDNTDYAVVMTTDIKDKAGNAVGPGTVAKILRFKNPLVVGGHSALAASGISDATAAQLEKMRLQLQPVIAALATAGVSESQLGLVYTFHTQTILSQAVQLGALPYTLPAATAQTGPITFYTPAAAFGRYGVPQTTPQSNIDEVLETDIVTYNLLDSLTGAFKSDPTMGAIEQIHVLVITPKGLTAPLCTGSLTDHCAPLMIFRHGLGRGRADVLLIGDTFAAQGMVTVAIDAQKFGDRSFCDPNGDPRQCASGATCTTSLPAGAQGDASPPGTCTNGKFQYLPVSPSCASPDSCGALPPGNNTGYLYQAGIPAVSGQYYISSNFFRTRDTIRQDMIDESQLTRVMAGDGVTATTLKTHLAGRLPALAVNPGVVYYSSQSLGSLNGAGNVATNPRISKAGFNVGGGTTVDVFTNAPAFASTTSALLNSIGIVPGTSAYLQFLVVAKTIIDPADPINFVGHLTANTLPNLLPPLGGATDGSVPQAPKKVLSQAAYCDNTVPNPFNFIFASNVPVGPTPAVGAAFFTPGLTGTFQLFVGTGFTPTDLSTGSCTATNAVEHGFLLDFVSPTRTVQAQTDIANFVISNTNPPVLR